MGSVHDRRVHALATEHESSKQNILLIRSVVSVQKEWTMFVVFFLVSGEQQQPKLRAASDLCGRTLNQESTAPSCLNNNFPVTPVVCSLSPVYILLFALSYCICYILRLSLHYDFWPFRASQLTTSLPTPGPCHRPRVRPMGRR
jgi:hypothetical protein